MNPSSRKFTICALSTLAGLGILSSCAAPQKRSSDSDIQTVVGRGGAFWDQRVQFINAIPNPKDDTTCLYLTEYNQKTAPKFDTNAPMNQEQLEFLDRVQREATPLTLFPVSTSALDAGAGTKFASDSEIGSMAIWINASKNNEISPAKIAHKLPSGDFLGNVGQIEGTCKL